MQSTPHSDLDAHEVGQMLPICNSADEAICSGPPEGDRVQLMVVRVVNYVREVNVDKSRSDLCSRCARRVVFIRISSVKQSYQR